jgi:hypothetical protein
VRDPWTGTKIKEIKSEREEREKRGRREGAGYLERLVRTLDQLRREQNLVIQ